MQITFQHTNIVNIINYKTLIINVNHFLAMSGFIKNALKIFTFGKSNNNEL